MALQLCLEGTALPYIKGALPPLPPLGPRAQTHAPLAHTGPLGYPRGLCPLQSPPMGLRWLGTKYARHLQCPCYAMTTALDLHC